MIAESGLCWHPEYVKALCKRQFYWRNAVSTVLWYWRRSAICPSTPVYHSSWNEIGLSFCLHGGVHAIVKLYRRQKCTQSNCRNDHGWQSRHLTCLNREEASFQHATQRWMLTSANIKVRTIWCIYGAVRCDNPKIITHLNATSSPSGKHNVLTSK